MKNNTILDIVNNYRGNKSTPEQMYHSTILKMDLYKKYNCSLSQVPFNHNPNPNSLLNGVVYSLKDNIATKDVKTTGGSLFLKDYIPPYNAYLKDLLDKAGAICVSKDNLDEFGLGGTGTHSAFGIVPNPWDDKRIAGGSSSGSTVMVSQNVVPFAIATDTGDSIRKPASFQGVVGFKPTYGAISRYGVYPYSPSLDHVGIIANNVDDIAIVFSTIAHKDNRDMTSIDMSYDYYNNLNDTNSYKVALLQDAYENMFDGEKKEFDKYLSFLDKKMTIAKVNFGIELLSLIDAVYKSLSYSEATSCWANLSGILFGSYEDGKNFNEIMLHSRTKNFGKQLKRRFIIGAYITSKENFENVFLKSKSIRTMIINRANEIFKDYDAILIPGSSCIAPLIDDVLKNKLNKDICSDALQIANFAGLPSITIPAIKYQKMPLGLNITCDYKQDLKALRIAKKIFDWGVDYE